MDGAGNFPGIMMGPSNSNVLCANVRLNQPLTGTLWMEAMRTAPGVFLLEDHTTLGAAPTDTEVQTYLAAENPSSTVGVTAGDGIVGVPPGSCTLPSLPPAPAPPAPVPGGGGR